MRVQAWMLRAWALGWSPILLWGLIVLRVLSLDTSVLGLPICVPFFLLVVAGFLVSMRHRTAASPVLSPYTILCIVPCSDLYKLAERWDNTVSVSVAFTVHSINTLVLFFGLYCLHRGIWISDTWEGVRIYLALVVFTIASGDLFIYCATGGAATGYIAPGGVDTLRASAFTCAVALVAVCTTTPRLRRLFLNEWTAVPLSKVRFAQDTREETLQESVRNITERITPAAALRFALPSSASRKVLFPRVLSASPQGGVPGAAPPTTAAAGGSQRLPLSRPPPTGTGHDDVRGGGGGGGGDRGGGGGGAAWSSRSKASSICSEEANSEIIKMTDELTAQHNAGVHTIGLAREAGRDPEWEGPGSCSSSRCDSRCDSRCSLSTRSSQPEGLAPASEAAGSGRADAGGGIAMGSAELHKDPSCARTNGRVAKSPLRQRAGARASPAQSS